jgi:uncharacterized protein with HEPN domain
MKSIESDILRLEGMLQAIEDAEQNMASAAEEKVKIHATIYNIMIIGEAAAKLSDKTKSAHPEIPWQQIIGMRNRLIHEYRKVLYSVLHEVIQKDIPVLKRQISEIYHRMDKPKD